MNRTGLVKKRRLEIEDLDQIRTLEEACNRAEGISIKFNWGMMRDRDASYASDFCYYRDGKLVGYAPLDGFGSSFEVTAAVLPAYRRQGIFRTLLEAARQQAGERQARELLLVSYPGSSDGRAVVGRLGFPYKFSEYHMCAQASILPPLPATWLQLEEVNAENVAELSRLLALNFEGARWNTPEALVKELEREDKRYFLARLEKEIIGQIGVIAEGGSVYIRAVGIIPERRGRGYGRQLLGAVMAKMLAEGCTEFSLEVAAENRHALSLYQSCGFHETTVFDYHTVPIRHEG